jgi:hypothetical protein
MRRRIKVGDRIKFKAATRDSYRIAIRVVRSFDNQGRPLVGLRGLARFHRASPRDYRGFKTPIIAPANLVSAVRTTPR